jgi:AcrR family transcriptional regulator
MGPAVAKGRGRYDRALSPSERARHHRTLIYDATLGLLCEPEAVPASANIDAVCALAGVGRNTVYGLFDNAGALTETCLDEALGTLASSLTTAAPLGTPIEDVRTFSTSWLRLARPNGREVRALLRFRRHAVVTLVSERLQALLLRGVAAGTFAPDPQGLRLILLSEAFVGALDHCERNGADGGGQGELSAALAELVLRFSR